MGTLINPHRPSPQDSQDFLPEPVYMRNPVTGMIFKIAHKDTLLRVQREFYTPSSEAEMREQAVELAELQGRPLPTATQTPAVVAGDDEPAMPNADNVPSAARRHR